MRKSTVQSLLSTCLQNVENIQHQCRVKVFSCCVDQMFLLVWGKHLAVESCAETPFYLSSLWKSPQMSGYVSSSKVKRQVLCVWRCGMRMGSGCLPTLLIKAFILCGDFHTHLSDGSWGVVPHICPSASDILMNTLCRKVCIDLANTCGH